jgi:hypothetical protein
METSFTNLNDQSLFQDYQALFNVRMANNSLNNSILQSFQTNSPCYLNNQNENFSNLLITNNNITPSTRNNDTDSSDSENENNDPNVKAKPRGKVKLEYVKDSKIRSNRKSKRKVSLL